MMNPVEAIEVEFNKSMVSGGTKKAMKQVEASSRDLWQVPVGEIRVIRASMSASRMKRITRTFVISRIR